MKRLAAITVLLATLLFSVLHSGFWGGFAHAAHGSMGEAADCMMGACPSDGAAGAGDCVAHCLAAAASEGNVVPPLAAAFVLLATALIGYAFTRPAAGSLARRGDDFIGRFILHQRLSTIVLRN